MKKLNDANIGILVLLSTCLCLFSCNNDNDNLPKDYAGFEHSKETVECEGNKSECELEIKIVAMEKAKEDRTAAVRPGQTGVGLDEHREVAGHGLGQPLCHGEDLFGSQRAVDAHGVRTETRCRDGVAFDGAAREGAPAALKAH